MEKASDLLAKIILKEKEFFISKKKTLIGRGESIKMNHEIKGNFE